MSNSWAALLCPLTCPRTFLLRHLKGLIYISVAELRIMHRSKNSFLEWLVYSLIFFFQYDIIWLLVDLPDFLQSVNGLYPELL